MAYLNAHDLVLTIIAGLVATTGMSLFALSFKRLGLLPVNTIRAIGSSVTGTMHSALPVGWTLHYTAGLMFAFLYAATLRFLGASTFGEILSMSLVLGLLHGVVTGFLLVINIGEYHQIESYREQGMAVAGVYFMAHILYAVLVGCVLYMGAWRWAVPPL